MGTGLQRHVHRRPVRIPSTLATVLQRRPLGMQPTQLSMKPLADRLPVTNNDSSDKRIGTHPPPALLSKRQRSQEMPSIRGCELGIHATD